MLKDLNVSDQFMKKYQMAFGKDLENKHGVELAVSVLSSNSWPIAQDISCTVPSTIGAMLDNFEKFYKEVNKGKCLKFCIQMSTAIIDAKFSKSSQKILDISGSQALVLLAFNQLGRG